MDTKNSIGTQGEDLCTEKMIQRPVIFVSCLFYGGGSAVVTVFI